MTLVEADSKNVLGHIEASDIHVFPCLFWNFLYHQIWNESMSYIMMELKYPHAENKVVDWCLSCGRICTDTDLLQEF